MKQKIVDFCNRKRIFIVLFLLFFINFVSFTNGGPQRQLSKRLKDYKIYPLIFTSEVKNVIFLIGDGMGITQIAATRIKMYGAKGRLHIEKMPVTGLIDTFSADDLVTDSAAAGTALAAGYKTNNGMISVTPDGEKTLTILEACKKIGKSTGLIATSRITHATPASFCAHVKSRDNEAEIAVQILKNRVNVILGGGKDFFIPESVKGSKRKDELDLIKEAKEKGYEYVENIAALNAVTGEYVLGLFRMGSMTVQLPEPTLAELTNKAIRILNRRKNGFFLMVEGSQIDWDCHENNTNEVFRKMVLFDEAVKVAIKFALKDKKTLVIVTGDHETGGMAINKGSVDGKYLSIKWISKNHTGGPLPLFAFGPSAVRFTGLYDNTYVPKLIAKLLGIKNFPALIK